MIAMSCIRAVGGPHLDPDQSEVLDGIRVHVAEAPQVRHRLRTQAMHLGIAREVLDRFGPPLMLVDGTVKIVYRHVVALPSPIRTREVMGAFGPLPVARVVAVRPVDFRRGQPQPASVVRATAQSGRPPP